MKILIDRNIERYAITHRTVMRQHTVQWGPKTIVSEVMDRERIELDPQHEFARNELPYLATLGVEARAGNLSLYTSFELNIERFRQPGPKDGWGGFDLLFDVPLPVLDETINRTLFLGPNGQSFGFSKKDQHAHYLRIPDDRYKFLRMLMCDHHIDDLFHFWTAERARLDYMLTMDGRFLRAFDQIAAKAASSVKLVTPKMLCNVLSKGPTDIDALAAAHPPFH